MSEVSKNTVGDREVIIKGRFPRVAMLWDEEWQEGGPFANPEPMANAIKESRLADVFTFAPSPFDQLGRYSYPFIMENLAAATLPSYQAWWESLPQESRKNVRRSQRRGVTTAAATFDDALVEGIVSIYNETPIRQGRRFWHYGKKFDAVKKENGTYPGRSVFIGAYIEKQLIGFTKVVFVNQVARIMQILALEAHVDKRPTNALLAKAIEVACERKASHFIYGQYVYGNKENSAMTEFKRRNGFERIEYPRYYIPISALGSLAITCKWHVGLSRMLPESIVTWLLRQRSAFYARRLNPVSGTR
jgi:hypothetical protein